MPVMTDARILPSSLHSYLASQNETLTGEIMQLQGGAISTTLRLEVDSGRHYVAKCLNDVPNDIYEKETAGLRALELSQCPRVPEVYAVGRDYLLLEDLGSGERSATYWEEFGHQVALLHSHTQPLFGYNHDNYLGRAIQQNPRLADGHAFFAQARVLRFLTLWQCTTVLTTEDRRRLGSFCARLPDLVPDQPAALCHGDLWHGNIAITDAGAPAYLDPAVHYGWPEADLGMTTQYEHFDDRFYDAYDEAGTLEPGWRDRLEIYHIKEILSMVAHFGEKYDSLIKLRAFLDRYA
ncbi:MAG: aminoglycoside phosphotransferase [Lysobacterales bacterium]|nr:MAG: aminoglycoside phosphotransferase [Xanthomonadales bacterium]